MEKKRSARRRESPEFWERHLKEWESSTLSQVAYCQLNSLGLKSFQYWKRKLCAPVPVSLVEIPFNISAPHCSRIQLQVGSRYRIEVEKGFDPELLHCLLGVIERR